jgi:hypothetical protein
VLFININKSRNEFRSVALGIGKDLQCAVIVRKYEIIKILYD